MNTRSMKLVIFIVLSWQLSYSLGTTEFPIIKCIAKEREALLALKQDFVDNYGILSSWRNDESHKDCCKWDHVHCNNQTGHVQKLNLHGTENASLQGTLSPSLTQLTHLRYLDISFTDFLLSHIPKFVSSLTNLRYLNLSSCYFGGKIPYEFGNLFRLQYLDLHSNLFDGEIPCQLSNLSKLRYLDLTFNDFSGEIPHQLGNLSSLQYLFVGPVVWDLNSNLEWLSHLSSSLRVLRMEEVDLSSANNWPKLIATLRQLQELHLRNCNLPNSVDFSVSSMNLSKSLNLIDLSSNNQASSVYRWLLNFNTSLVVLKLTDNFLHGSIPNSFAKLSSLQELWLGENMLEGGVPKSLWGLCNLSVVRLNDNTNLTGPFVDFVPRFFHCAKNSLKILDLSWNYIFGTFPNFSHISCLQELYLDGNQINGTLSETIGHLSNLEVLSATKNSLEGTISETHFLNLSKLHNLDLRSNALTLKVSADDWTPPFQLKYIYLSGCKLGPQFPTWLHTQKSCMWLDISSSDIADTVPQWFWYMSLSLQNVNVSHNQLKGVIPNLPLEYKGFAQVDLSSNQFQGPIPSFLSTARSLYLSYNNFTDSSLLLCTTKATYLFLLDLSNNQLSEIPDCWMNLKALSILNLADNNLLGNIPTSMGLLFQIQAIHLRNNHLRGELPNVLGNCTELRIFDVGHNNFSGPIPIWIGEKLQKLLVLIMNSNQFDGIIPLSMCQLAHIRILDISLNEIQGNIPSCVSNFTALASRTSASNATIGYSFNSADSASYVYYDSASVTWKGKEWEYKNTLGLLKAMDFSSNKLVGEIPCEITHLVGLISLNLSRNRLIGKIPSDIGELESLDALDLSRNFLFGKIPSSLSKISRLSVLHLSYNNLSGEIPERTQLQSFNSTDFEGNPRLCGKPLPKMCPENQNDDTPNNGNKENDEDDKSFLDYGFYISLVLGFIVGFWGVCGTLVLNSSWRFAYFNFFGQLYASTTINIARLHGMLKEFKERYLKRQDSNSIANSSGKWATSLERKPKDNNWYYWSSLSMLNNYRHDNSKESISNSSMFCRQICDKSGHSAQNCDQVESSSSHAMATGYGLDPGVSSSELYHNYDEGNDEIILTHG